jgi:hypothetical protein
VPTGTFAELAKDPSIGRAEALRRAMMAMLDPENPPEFAHPSAWALTNVTAEAGADGPDSTGSPMPRNGVVAWSALANCRNARSEDTAGSTVTA